MPLISPLMPVPQSKVLLLVRHPAPTLVTLTVTFLSKDTQWIQIFIPYLLGVV